MPARQMPVFDWAKRCGVSVSPRRRSNPGAMRRSLMRGCSRRASRWRKRFWRAAISQAHARWQRRRWSSRPRTGAPRRRTPRPRRRWVTLPVWRRSCGSWQFSPSWRCGQPMRRRLPARSMERQVLSRITRAILSTSSSRRWCRGCPKWLQLCWPRSLPLRSSVTPWRLRKHCERVPGPVETSSRCAGSSLPFTRMTRRWRVNCRKRMQRCALPSHSWCRRCGLRARAALHCA